MLVQGRSSYFHLGVPEWKRGDERQEKCDELGLEVGVVHQTPCYFSKWSVLLPSLFSFFFFIPGAQGAGGRLLKAKPPELFFSLGFFEVWHLSVVFSCTWIV